MSEKEHKSARAQIALLEKNLADVAERAARAEEHAIDLEKRIGDANARSTRAGKDTLESKAPDPKELAPNRDAAPAPEGSKGLPANSDRTKSPLVESLAKFAGKKATMSALGEAPDAAEAGSLINAASRKPGGRPQRGSERSEQDVGPCRFDQGRQQPGNRRGFQAGIVDALRLARWDAVKADSAAEWSRCREPSALVPVTAPTEAAIRIVIITKYR